MDASETPETDEELFDDYSRQLEAGGAPDPDEFLKSHPSASGELRESLRRMFRRAPRFGSGGAGDANGTDHGLPFERLGDFKLVRRLGGGGMGIVFLAVQESLGRQVALKVLRPELQGSAVAAERFRREARALAELRHPNLVTIFGGGEERGVRYLAMELVPGTSLDELLRGDDFTAIPIARRVRWIAALARGLQHAHERGVVHRDVKPANVRITPDDRALLLDFGLARREGSEGGTITESFAGSPHWAAPEQIQQGGAIDGRTDVYALGVTLYQVLTGRVPFGDSGSSTVEQVFHRILTATPLPPRKLAPALPRDLEIVTLKAFERAPEQRYATAAALADDLEAVLELRSIRGRPPGALERARRQVRSHPLLATALATALVAALVLAGVMSTQARAREQARREESARLVSQAHARVGDYRAQRESLAALQTRVKTVQREVQSMHYGDAEYALLDRHEAQLEDEQRAWEQIYYEVLDLLRQAERVDPSVRGADAVRGELYLARYREALDLGEPAEAEFFRELAAKSDPALARELAVEAKLEIASDPTGADVWLFRFEELSRLKPDGEARMVALPVQDEPCALAPGAWALRVTRDAPPLLRHDLVVAIAGAPVEGSLLVIDGGGAVNAGDRLLAVDGARVRDDWDANQLAAPAPEGAPPRRFEFEQDGEKKTLEARSLRELGITVAAAGRFGASPDREAVPCSILRDGKRLEAELPPAAPVRATARALVTSPACRVGRTPLHVEVPRGDYLLVVRRDGSEEVRWPLSPSPSSPTRVAFRLTPQGMVPEGFRFVLGWAADGADDFWMQEREVTATEWREFLNDPAQRRRIAGKYDRLVPRTTSPVRPYWDRAADGSWSWPDTWRGEWPIVGISWEDARDYVKWRNESMDAASRFEFALPTQPEFHRAALGKLAWRYVYGNRLRPRFSRCCFSRPNANCGPVLEFPIDESPSGVFDLTGSAFEWLDHWYDEPRNMRMLAGGAWGQAMMDHLLVSGGIGIDPKFTTGETGLRLVLRRRGAEPPR